MMRLRVGGRRPHSLDEVPEYWITYSDLLVGLLMVFVLLLFLTLSRMQRDVANVRAILAANETALSLAARSLKGTGAGLYFDPKTQALAMDAEVLFGYGSATLRPEAQRIIYTVATKFLPRLLSNHDVDSQLQEIAVIGHTDTVGTYIWNMDLSQRRAYSVMRAVVEATYGQPHAERLRDLITASGKSEVEPVMVDGHYDPDRSRRIELHIRFRNEDLLKRLVGEGANAVKR